jgi:arylsulfatase A
MSKTKIMKKIVPVLLAGFLFLSGCKIGGQNGRNSGVDGKPNILFILIDDMGWSDAGCYGGSSYDTPNIDRLAGQGVRFTQAYAACSVCSPTRASIITGKYPARLHLTDWLPGRKDYSFQELQNPEINQHLPYDISTLPGILKENGYQTAIFGKWHLGEDSASTQRQGFDLHLPRWNQGWPNGTYFSPYHMEGLEGGPDGEYLTDRLTDETLKYIDEHKDNPFFIYLAHFAVHDPIMGRPDLVDKYREKLKSGEGPGGVPFILEGNPDSPDPLSRETLDRLINEAPYQGYSLLPRRTVKIKQQQDNPEFAAMVESVDQSVGRILYKLRELGLEENTIVVFFSDNGGMSAANFGNPARKIKESALDKAYSTSNLPLRGGKGWFYEGGIREPLIIKWPGHEKAGSVCEVPVISVDFLPTLLEMAGIPFNPEKLVLDGESLVPLLKGEEPKQDRPIFWHFPHYSNHGQQSPCGAVRFGDFKLIEYYENYSVQLFNLADDPGEQNDLSDSLPDKGKELREMLHRWRQDVDAQMMPPNPGFDPAMGWMDYAEGDSD